MISFVNFGDQFEKVPYCNHRLGGMGGAHAQAVKLEANCELVAGAEINQKRAEAWRERFKVNKSIP